MKAFAALYAALDATTKTNAKIDAMVAYFAAAAPADAAWALFFLTGQRIKRLVGSSTLRAWALEATDLPPWLMDESYAAVGDSAETVALLLDAVPTTLASLELGLAAWLETRILPLRDLTEPERQAAVLGWWRGLDREQRFVLNKLLTGALRVGVSRGLVVRAIARLADLDPAVVGHRLMGPWRPTPAAWQQLLEGDDGAADASRPYPFFLASPLEAAPASLGPRDRWLAEWKWDGVRGQLVKRQGAVHLWSRGEELVTERFPEIERAGLALPDGTVLDGEILAWNDAGVMPFAALQTRIGRLKLSAKSLREAPVRFLAYDLLEEAGQDVRGVAQGERRRRLEALVATAPPALGVSPLVEAADWPALAALRLQARHHGVEGLMLKRRDAAYRAGRRRGDWWKWKLDPLSVDAVLIYAQAGSGRRANLFTDYTFALWDDGRLVPFAKAYSGLDDKEIAELDRWIRRHVVERFGPVRQVAPVQVFELAFEGIQVSARHKSGIAVRFPRIARWRRDKPASEADSLASIKRLLSARA
ncbi:MAG: ATP-dependent DNA ligase [Geminicoccaceae bacterium]|nr:MAG: ATP-dependent DNA ligase [Geminicoccaceae bacterium]